MSPIQRRKHENAGFFENGAEAVYANMEYEFSAIDLFLVTTGVLEVPPNQ